MTGSDRKDSFGYLGSEDLSAKELLRCLSASLEKMARSEGAEAVELAHGKARDLLARLEPLIAESADVRSSLEAAVRKQPLLAVALAAAAGFLLASVRRR